MRVQYHFRPSEKGLLAWDVCRLVELSKDLPTKTISVSEIAEFDENHWYSLEGQAPTCRSIIEHLKLIEEADLSHTTE